MLVYILYTYCLRILTFIEIDQYLITARFIYKKSYHTATPSLMQLLYKMAVSKSKI